MPRHLDPADLPMRVATFAQAEIAAGHYASIEAVLEAGVEALRERASAEEEWAAYAQKEAAKGFAEIERGQGIRATAEEHIVRIDAAVRARLADRVAK